MDVGTINTLIPKRKRKIRRAFLRNSPGDSGDGNNGDNGGGDRGGDKPKKNEIEFEEPALPNKSKILMWFLLLVVMMTFGALFAAYVVIATTAPLEWRPLASLPFQAWISTAIILAASFSYHRAESALKVEKEAFAKRWFLITTVLGASFISSQLILWLELVNRGLYMKGNPYIGFFYILTMTHAVHVIGGIIALGYIILRTWDNTPSVDEKEKRVADATAIGRYWHTMGVLWLALLFLLGFWK